MKEKRNAFARRRVESMLFSLEGNSRQESSVRNLGQRPQNSEEKGKVGEFIRVNCQRCINVCSFSPTNSLFGSDQLFLSLTAKLFCSFDFTVVCVLFCLAFASYVCEDFAGYQCASKERSLVRWSIGLFLSL